MTEMALGGMDQRGTQSLQECSVLAPTGALETATRFNPGQPAPLLHRRSAPRLPISLHPGRSGSASSFHSPPPCFSSQVRTFFHRNKKRAQSSHHLAQLRTGRRLPTRQPRPRLAEHALLRLWLRHTYAPCHRQSTLALHHLAVLLS